MVLVKAIGYVGFALAYAVTMVGAASASVILVKRAIHIRLWPQIRSPLTIALLVALAGGVVVHLFEPSLWLLLLTTAAMGLVYLGAMWLAEGSRLRNDVGSLIGMGAAQ